MANVIEVLIKGLVSDEFKKALDQASQSVEGFANKVGQSVENINKRFEGMNKGFEALGKSMIGIGGALSIGITAPTVALAAGAVQAGANIEKLTIAFQPLLGSAQAATKRMAELQQFANLTPFELPEVAKASRMLEVMTKGVLATGDALRMVGDIASGVGQGFDEVAMWVGRLYDGLKSGRPVGEATMRLQEMGAMSGDTRNKLEEMAKSGARFSDVWAVATQAFGRFAGGMELQANSVAGKISTLHDSAQTALASLGRSFEDITKKIIDLATALMDKLGALAQWFGNLPEPVKLLTLGVLALVAAIGPLLVGFGAILLAIPGLIAGWAALVPLVASATAAIAASALSIAAWTIVAGLMIGWLTLLAVAIGKYIEMREAQNEADEKALEIETKTQDILERRGVGLEYRQALRKAGYDVGIGSETSQSQGAGSYAAYMEQQGAAKTASDAAAAKVHEEFVKTDRATLIAKENERYKEQKTALGDNVAAIKELNSLHKAALEDIDKKVGYKPGKAAAKVDPKDQQMAKNFEALGQERNAEAELIASAEAKEQNQVEVNKFLAKQAEDKAKHEAELDEKLFQTRKHQEEELDKKRSVGIHNWAAGITSFTNRLSGAMSSLFAPMDQMFGRMQRRNNEMTLSWTRSFQNIGLAFAKMIADMAAEVLKRMTIWLMLKAIGSIFGGGSFGAAVDGVTGKGGGGFGKFVFGSFDVGTPRIPHDMFGQLHEGEKIIPRTFSEAIDRGELTLGGPGGGGSSHGATIVLDSDIMAVIKRNGSALVKVFDNQGKVSFA